MAMALMPLFTILPAEAAIKCWKNKDGVRECGDAVPPEYAQQGHETKDSRGLTIDKQDRAKTMEELEVERAQARVEAQRAIEERKRETLDKVLLDTFASEDDLILTRDGQIAHLDAQIRLTRSHIEKLEKNLDQMIERAADVERRGAAPSEEMIANIESVRDQISENEAFITTKHQEQENIRQRFAADIDRFKELKGGK
jgi:chromosome segregation ATPase